MDVERFRESPVGSLTPIDILDSRTGEAYNHFAFVPNALPSELVLSQETWRAISEANYALGQLQQGGLIVPDPSLLRRPSLRLEAQSTSALEGTFAPIEDVFAADILKTETTSPALGEVWNYIKAADYAFDSIATRSLSVGLLCELHEMLVSDTESDGPEAGRIRTIAVAIGTPGRSIAEARFVPPPPGMLLESEVQHLVDWIRNPPELMDAVAAAALAHYQFETLHPFNDGNGRIGRLLIVLQLMMSGRIDQPVLTVSPWFEARRVEYQDALAEVSASGNWDQWIRFFADGIRASAQDAASRLRRLLATKEAYNARLTESGSRGGVIREIVDILIQDPVVTIPHLATRTVTTYPAVKSAVYKLVELGILEEFTRLQGAKHFLASEVLRIIMD